MARTATTSRPGASSTTQRQSTAAPRRTVTSTRPSAVTVPTLSLEEAGSIVSVLQQRLVALVDLAATIKHVHWNVVGPHFMSVHQMLDPHHDGVQQMIDRTAERIATLGGVPSGLPGVVTVQRTWDDYSLGRADAIAHLGALDLVYTGVITDHRTATEEIDDVDPISGDLLIGMTGELEQYQWFVRSHLADWAGGVVTAGARTELDAAQAVIDKRPAPGTRHSAGAHAGRPTPASRRAASRTTRTSAVAS